jgi:hypothetical protein
MRYGGNLFIYFLLVLLRERRARERAGATPVLTKERVLRNLERAALALLLARRLVGRTVPTGLTPAKL